ncbi:hypothetical protein LTS18_006648 [Coniosporium uncinatum]|uniref:Uncharacterized protein n=1 Tax=Coniosporium uncinatum TaxID=93489 RepID=A0ACC3DQH9_9PEZI|nr:hypothetical protein LTS18_006648 [Coniosporium uncinatum]
MSTAKSRLLEMRKQREKQREGKESSNDAPMSTPVDASPPKVPAEAEPEMNGVKATSETADLEYSDDSGSEYRPPVRNVSDQVPRSDHDTAICKSKSTRTPDHLNEREEQTQNKSASRSPTKPTQRTPTRSWTAVNNSSSHSKQPAAAPAVAEVRAPPLLIHDEIPNYNSDSETDFPKSGKFTDAEILRITGAVAAFRAENDLTQHQVNELVQDTSQQADCKVLWSHLCGVVPRRHRTAVARFVRRRWHNFPVRGKWTAEDDERLKRAYEGKPNRWREISGEVGRFEEDCRDRWRNYLKMGQGMNKDVWTADEEKKFVEIVFGCLRALSEDHKKQRREERFANGEEVGDDDDDDEDDDEEKADGDDNDGYDAEEHLNWNIISDRLGTRSRLQCSVKWKYIRDRLLGPKKTATTNGTSTPSANPNSTSHYTAAGNGTAMTASSKNATTTRKKNVLPRPGPEARDRYAKMLPGDKYDIVKAIKATRTRSEEMIPWDLIRMQMCKRKEAEGAGAGAWAWRSTDMMVCWRMLTRTVALMEQRQRERDAGGGQGRGKGKGKGKTDGIEEEEGEGEDGAEDEIEINDDLDAPLGTGEADGDATLKETLDKVLRYLRQRYKGRLHEHYVHPPKKERAAAAVPRVRAKKSKSARWDDGEGKGKGKPGPKSAAFVTKEDEREEESGIEDEDEGGEVRVENKGPEGRTVDAAEEWRAAVEAMEGGEAGEGSRGMGSSSSQAASSSSPSSSSKGEEEEGGGGVDVERVKMGERKVEEQEGNTEEEGDDSEGGSEDDDDEEDDDADDDDDDSD